MRAFPALVVALVLSACFGGGSTVVPPVPRADTSLEVGRDLDVTMGLVNDPSVSGILAQISADTIRQIDSMLVSFGTRHTMSDTVSTTRGIGAARRWIHERLSGFARACNGCLRVEYDPAMIVVERHPQKPSVNVVNVLAILPGRDTSRVIVMGGHYDSCVCSTDRFDITTDAPGADDDGSGTAAVMELARVFSKLHPRGLESTVIFALYSGEELGLLGSAHLADRLKKEGKRIVAGMTNDIVGNVVADDGSVDSSSVRIFSSDPDNGPSRELARYVWAMGGVYQREFAVIPVYRLDRIGRGGDHIPFARQGDAGLRFSERLENYKRQHLPTDVLEHVSFPYVAKVARLNAATIAGLGMAPAVPDSARAQRDRESGGQKWRLSWRPVANAASYEVLIRRTTSPTWERTVRVGRDTTYLLSEQLDDLWAGVRAVSETGQRSLTAVLPPPTFFTR